MVDELRNRAERALKGLRGMRHPRTLDVFAKRYVIGPEDFYVENYPRKRPASVFNPGVIKMGNDILLFPRLIFEYYSYTSSIGVVKVSLEEVISGKMSKPLHVKIVLWPQTLWESIQGCEDPRIFSHNEKILILYTGVGLCKIVNVERKASILALAELDREFRTLRKGFFYIASSAGNYVLENKDSAFIKIVGKRAMMLTRPRVPGVPNMCWRAQADLENLFIFEDSLHPVFPPEEWEYKVGWSTNTIPIFENQYLVGWHGVFKEDNSYRNGLALVNEKGELLAISDYLLAPKGLEEGYGDRSLTIFGDGLLVHENYLVWIGGVSDYAIGVFVANLKDVLSELRYV